MPIDASKVSRDHCVAWAANPTTNPISGRKIEKDKSTYKDLQEICQEKFNISVDNKPNRPNLNHKPSVPSKPSQPGKPSKTNKPSVLDHGHQGNTIGGIVVTKDHCLAWASKPTINPITKKPIQLGKQTYNQLDTICKNIYNINVDKPNRPLSNKPIPNTNKPSISTIPDVTVTSNKAPSIPNTNKPGISTIPYDTSDNAVFANKIRGCQFVKFKRPVPNSITPRRKSIFSDLHANDLQSLKSLYLRLGICEAPPHINMNQAFIDTYEGIPDCIRGLLHVIHGDCVNSIPWVLKYDSMDKITLSKYEPVINITTDREESFQFKNLFDSVQKTGKPLCTYIGVNVRGEHIGHALMLVLYKAPWQSKVQIAIIDPMMSNVRIVYADMVTEYFTDQKDYYNAQVVGRVIHDNMYQNGNVHVPDSSLDLNGHCALWVCLMMDIFGNNVNSGMAINNMADVKKAIYPPVHLSPLTMAPWRKLVIDYTVSRLFAVHLMACKLKDKGLNARYYLEQGFILKYMESFAPGLIMDELIRYMKEPDGKAFAKRMEETKDQPNSDFQVLVNTSFSFKK